MIKKIDDPKKLLLHISRLFAKPGKWTRGDTARDKGRKCVDAESRAAVSFCSAGALSRFSGSASVQGQAEAALRSVINSGIAPWNDTRGPRGAGVVSRAFAQAAASL